MVYQDIGTQILSKLLSARMNVTEEESANGLLEFVSFILFIARSTYMRVYIIITVASMYINRWKTWVAHVERIDGFILALNCLVEMHH